MNSADYYRLSDLYSVSLKTTDHLSFKLWIFSGHIASFKIGVLKVQDFRKFELLPTYQELWFTIQLLTIEALDLIWCRPESTYIDWGGAEVNFGILRSISYHVQCLNSQQLFYYIISLNKKATTTTKSWLWTVSWTVLNFFFLHDD